MIRPVVRATRRSFCLMSGRGDILWVVVGLGVRHGVTEGRSFHHFIVGDDDYGYGVLGHGVE